MSRRIRQARAPRRRQRTEGRCHDDRHDRIAILDKHHRDPTRCWPSCRTSRTRRTTCPRRHRRPSPSERGVSLAQDLRPGHLLQVLLPRAARQAHLHGVHGDGLPRPRRAAAGGHSDGRSISQPRQTSDDSSTLETVNCVGACALAPLVIVDGLPRQHDPAKVDRLYSRSPERTEEAVMECPVEDRSGAAEPPTAATIAPKSKRFKTGLLADIRIQVVHLRGTGSGCGLRVGISWPGACNGNLDDRGLHDQSS